MEIGGLNDKELAALEAVLAALAESDSGILADEQVIGIVGGGQAARKICGLLKQQGSAIGYKYGGECSIKRTGLTASHHATGWYREQRKDLKRARCYRTIAAVAAAATILACIASTLKSIF